MPVHVLEAAPAGLPSPAMAPSAPETSVVERRAALVEVVLSNGRVLRVAEDIRARLASGIARKVRLKPSERFQPQPELTVVHQNAPFQGFESQRFPSGKALYGSGP